MQVPDDILKDILCWVHTKGSLIPSMLVCRSWHTQAAEIVWRDIYLEHGQGMNNGLKLFVALFGIALVGQDVLVVSVGTTSQLLETYCRITRTLTISRVKSNIINVCLSAMIRYMYDLRQLDVSGCKRLTDATICGHGQFTHLNMSRCSLITDITIISVASQCPDLLNLDINDCNLVTDKGIQAIATSCPRLVVLDVSRNTNADRVTCISVKCIACSTNVAVLGIGGCSVDIPAIHTLTTIRGPHLNAIKIGNNSKITSDVLDFILERCPLLANMDICGCHSIIGWRCTKPNLRVAVCLHICTVNHIEHPSILWVSLCTVP